MKIRNRGFTLIELLVVIAIIGLLATMAVISFGGAQNKARTAVAQTELAQISKAIQIARYESSTYLKDITGSACSVCACTTDMRGIPDTDTCYIRWINALTAIQMAADGIVQGIDTTKRDPWNSPYGMDENEAEIPANPCREDILYSAGPDGIFRNGDDVRFYVPLLNTQCP